MLEIQNTVKVNIAFDGLISRFNMAEERLSKLDDMLIETSKTGKQIEKKSTEQSGTILRGAT